MERSCFKTGLTRRVGVRRTTKSSKFNGFIPVFSARLISVLSRGIHFYDFSPEEVVAGLRFGYEREPLHAKDPNSIRLGCGPAGTLGHLGREASAHLAPLLNAGFDAHGYVLSSYLRCELYIEQLIFFSCLCILAS